MNPDATAIAVTASILSISTLVTVLIIYVRQTKLLNRYRKLLNGPAGPDLERLLLGQAETLETMNRDLAYQIQQLSDIQQKSQVHIQKTAIVRFNAFPDTGSDLSFAIALLDANNNGMVLSSLYARNESRIYAKPIQNGQSTYTLSDEERAAISKALGGPNSSPRP